jgi:PAS domain S-box-containing protein
MTKVIDLATGQDHEKVQLANAVAEEEDFSNLVVRFSNDGILVVDSSGRYTVWNPVMEKISGMKKEQVLGRNWLEVFPFFRGSPVEAAVAKALQGESIELEPYAYEIPETKQRGFTQQRSTPIYNEEGKIIGVLSVVRDVTESMKDHERLQEENARLKKELGSK